MRLRDRDDVAELVMQNDAGILGEKQATCETCRLYLYGDFYGAYSKILEPTLSSPSPVELGHLDAS